MMRTLTRSIAFATILAFGAACSDDSNSPSERHVGTYTLISMFGDPVPSTVESNPDYMLEATSGTLQINGNGSWTEVTNWRLHSAGGVEPFTTTCTGTLSRSGGNITFTQAANADCDADTFAATFANDNTITIEPGTLDIVYRK